MRNQYRTLFEVYSENIQSVAPSSILDKIDTDVAHMKAIKVTNQWSLDFIKYKEYYKKYLINRAKKENFFDNENRINVDGMWEVYSDSTEERMREELMDYVGDEAVDHEIDQEQIDEEVDDNFYKDFRTNYLPEIKAEYEKKYNDIIMKPSKELGIDIDIEENNESYSDLNSSYIIFPYFKVIHKWKDRDEFTEWLYKKLGIKPNMFDREYVKNWTHAQMVAAYIDIDCDGARHNYYKYIADKDEADRKVYEDTLWGLKKNYKDFKQWKKTQDLLKKGSEEAGMEIDIEENNESYSDLNSSYIIFPYFKVIHKWKDRDEFTEWLYKKLGIKPNMFDREYVKNWTHAQMVAAYIDIDCDGARHNYYKYIADKDEADRKVYEDTLWGLKKNYKDFKQWKKTQDLLKKGSEEAGMEIDIEESNNSILLKRSNNEHDYGDIYGLVKHWEDGDMFIKWLSERTGDWPRHNKDNPLQEWWDNTVNRFSLLDPNRYNKKKRTVEDNIELALTSIEFFYDEFVNTDYYLKTKATQDILNKGSKETGIDI